MGRTTFSSCTAIIAKYVLWRCLFLGFFLGGLGLWRFCERCAFIRERSAGSWSRIREIPARALPLPLSNGQSPALGRLARHRRVSFDLQKSGGAPNSKSIPRARGLLGARPAAVAQLGARLDPHPRPHHFWVWFGRCVVVVVVVVFVVLGAMGRF